MKDQEIMEFDTILKDEQIITMLAIQPDVIDSQKEAWSKEAITRAKDNYDEHFRHWGVMHRDKEGRYYNLLESNIKETWQDSWDDSIELLDSYIIPNNSVIGKKQVPAGSWIINAHIKDEELWQRIKNKELNGASVAGLAIRMPVNSHKQVIDSIISEISLVPRPANRQPFLVTKNMDEYLAPFPNFHACRLKEPNLFQPDSFKTIESKTGKVNLIIGRLKGQTSTTLQSIRYPVESYTEDIARQHCEKYPNSKFEAARKEEKNET